MTTNFPEGDPTRLLNRRFLGSFAVVALLLVLNQLLVQPQLLLLAIDPPTINRAGRQRMLSQRVAKSALALARSDDLAVRRRLVAELAEARSQLRESHTLLRQALEARPASRESAAIRLGLSEVEPSFERLLDASARFLAASPSSGPSDTAGGRSAIADILASEAEYLRRMDRVVGEYEVLAAARVNRLLWTGRVLTGLVAAVLGALSLLVLRPASAIIRRQIAELREAHDQLEHKVRERTAALERANHQLEQEAQRRAAAEARHRAVQEIASDTSRINSLGEMASGLAHELNQPLGAIANYAEGCQVELERPAPDLAEVRTALRKLLTNAHRASDIVKRVRRFVTRHGLEYEAFSPVTALQEAVDLLTDDARQRGVDLRIVTVSNLPLAWGDPVQIQQVLINLLRNALEAIDAAPGPGKTVTASVREAPSGFLVFQVQDTGEGIPPAQLTQIFEPFFSTRANGMGIGLAISRTMVEAHQGTLSVESVPGVGTVFRFTVPSAGVGDDDRIQGVRG